MIAAILAFSMSFTYAFVVHVDHHPASIGDVEVYVDGVRVAPGAVVHTRSSTVTVEVFYRTERGSHHGAWLAELDRGGVTELRLSLRVRHWINAANVFD